MGYIGTPIDTRNQFQSLQGKRFNGDGSTTDFTLDVAPGSTLDFEVFVGNVRQDPNSAYTLSGTTLSFTGAPPSGTNNIYVVHQAKSVGTIDVPALGVSTASIQADAITEAKIADDAVESEHLNNNIISGQTELAATPADTDEFLISDAGTLKRVDYSYIKGGGMNLVATANVTSAAANVSFDNCFSSTYRNYLMVADMVVATNAATIEWRYRNGGSDESGNYYNQYFTRYKTDTDDRYKHRTSSVNSFRTGVTLKNATDEVSFAFSMYFHNPNNGSTHSKLYMNAIFKDNDGYSGNLNGIGAFHAQSAHDGIKFFPSSGNFTNATVRIYGLIDS